MGPGQVPTRSRADTFRCRVYLCTQPERTVGPCVDRHRVAVAQARSELRWCTRSARWPVEDHRLPAVSRSCLAVRRDCSGQRDAQLLDLKLVGRPLQQQLHRPDGIVAKARLINGKGHLGSAVAGYESARTTGRELGDALDRSGLLGGSGIRSRSSQRASNVHSSASSCASWRANFR